MNQAKMQSIERGLNGSARKILEHVEFDQERTLHEITQSLNRAGCPYQVSTILGCLKQMRDQGLLRNKGEHWIRERPHLPPPTSIERKAQTSPIAFPDAPPAPAETTTIVPPLDPVRELAELAKTLRSASTTFAAAANKAEEIALQLEEQLGRESEEITKLRELRDVLKRL